MAASASLGGMTKTIEATAAGTWRLGDLTVNRMGFGAMRLTGSVDGTPSDRDTAISVLRKAIELGVNHIDTAAFYFSATRSANELINTALRPYPDDLVITSKIGAGRDPSGQFLTDVRPEDLRGQLEENIRQLGLDYLDVVNLRVGLGLERGTGSVAEMFGALSELRDAGLVRHLGISNVGPEQLREALSIAPVVCVQNMYSLTHRREDDALIALCAQHDVAFVPFFAVGGRQALPDPIRDAVDAAASASAEAAAAAVEKVAADRGVTPAQVRLAWTLHQGPNVLAIPGTGNVDHLVENVAAGAIELSSDELATLDPVRQA